MNRPVFLVIPLFATIASAAAGPELRRVPIASTSLASAGYARKAEILEIEFRSGAVYRYRGVPKDIYAGLLNAPSKGRFFATHIRGKFVCERIPKPLP